MKQNKAMISLTAITGQQPFLSGNSLGKEVFQKLLGEVDKDPEVVLFEISLDGISATDASFPRESVVSLIKMYSGEKAFFLSGFATKDLMDNWDYAAKAKSQAVIVHLNPNEYEVLGPGLSASTKALLEYVMTEGEVTTAAVAQHFKVSAQNASGKMKKLLSMGVPGELAFQAATGRSKRPRQCLFHR